jgi:hypothetical protein
MPTLGPTLNENGIFVPDYSDIYAQLRSQYLSIYGADTTLDADDQDGQFLAIFAQAISDCDNAAQDVYNAFGLNTAQGAGLSSLVKITGTRRAVTGFSTDMITIVGTPNTPINNGQVGDNLGQGSIWNLPSLVLIPNSGTIDVPITNTVAGPSIFAPGGISVILTPTLGWASVVNIGPANAGPPVQTDSQLRQVASNSVAGPANTILDSIFAAVSDVANITRFFIYENDTDIVDANGQGPHSIYPVIQGGSTSDIVNAIGSTKSPGTTTLGTVSGTYVDRRGVPNVISYYPLTLVPITVIVNLTKLSGYTVTSATLIKQAVVAYLLGLSIGEDSYLSRLYSPANLSGDAATSATGVPQSQLDGFSATYNITSILQSRPSDAPPAVQDVPIAFNEATTCVIANVIVNAT